MYEAIPCCAKGNQALSAAFLPAEGKQISVLRYTIVCTGWKSNFWKLITCSKTNCDKSSSHSDAAYLLMFDQLQE